MGFNAKYPRSQTKGETMQLQDAVKMVVADNLVNDDVAEIVYALRLALMGRTHEPEFLASFAAGQMDLCTAYMMVANAMGDDIANAIHAIQPQPLVYKVAYYAAGPNGAVMGVADVPTSRPGCRPSWADCARVIPGFVTARSLADQETR